jgi:probable phosphoglycerate mutase
MALSLPARLTLYFCRHGETEANVERRFQGRTIDTPLTQTGRLQAEALARALQTHEPDPGRLQFVSSPLQRAQTTIEIIREGLGLSATGYAIDPRIAEIDLGKWDGLTDAQARALDPATYDRRQADKWNVRVPGGEDYADVAKRCEGWIADLRTDSFAVTHGAFTRILRGLFEGLTWKQMSDLDEKQGVLFRVRGSDVERFETHA